MSDKQPPSPTDARATRQESDKPTVTITTTTTPMTQGTIAPPSRNSRKDALLHHKHGRSISQGRVTPLSNTTITTANTSSGNGNNNNRRHHHNHAVNISKTRPMMRSVSNQSQHPNDQKQHQNTSTTTASTIATITTGVKSERRARTSAEHKTRRKPKFVCGDLADEVQLSSDQQQLHQQLTHSHGAARVEEGESEGGEGGEGEGVLESGRALEHDGYHPYHSPRHKHDPYPASPSRHHISPQQAHHLQPTEVARGRAGRGKDTQAVSSHQGNLDLERGPNSESIPNNGQRPHPLPRPSSNRLSKEMEETKKQPEMAAIRLKASDDMIPTPAPSTKTTTASAANSSPLQPSMAHTNTSATKANLPSASSSTPSSPSSEESDVAAIRATLTNLALVEKENGQEQNRQGQQESDNRISKDKAIVSKGKSGSEEVSCKNRETKTTTTGQPKVLELTVHNSSNSSTTSNLNPSASTVTAGSHHPTSHQRPTTGASATAAIMSPLPSKRLTRLLNPSLSTTSLPSLSKTTSEPIVASVSPNHRESDILAEHADAPSSNIQRTDSPLSQQEGQQRASTGASTTSPAVDLFSKILNPVVATLGRSRSQSSLQAMFASALTGSPTTSPSTTPKPQQHRRHGSSASLAGSVRSSPGTSSSGNGMGFMTSPPRVADPNVYLISRFITPVSQAALGSSAPKQKARPLSNSGAGPMTVKRRLPASLRMSTSDADVAAGRGGEGGGGSTSATAGDAIGETPTSPGAGSTYSSNEGPTSYPNSRSGTPPPPFSTSSFLSPISPWNPVEAMSRTQQKLLLQRDSSHDELDEEEMSRRGKTHKEMERIQREYKCIRMTSDPVMESMARCFALQRERIEQQCQSGGGNCGGDGKEERGVQSRQKTF